MIEPRFATLRAIPDYLIDLQVYEPVGAHKARQIIFEALSRAADREDTCPTSEMLIELTALQSLSTAVYHVRQLEARGDIAVKRHQRSRVVKIVATGKSTKPSTETLPHWRARGSIHRETERA
jgi:hypothetical protein